MPVHAGAPLFLDSGSFRSEQQFLAEVARSVCGLTRYAYELVAGENPFVNEPQATPMNPQGRIGVDCSGPPWGGAVLHPVGCAGGIDATANLLGETILLSLPDTVERELEPWILWNRPHAMLPSPYVAPYDRLRLVVRAIKASGADATVTVRLRTISLRGRTEGDIIHERETDIIVGTTEATYSVTTFQQLTGGHVAVVASFQQDTAEEVRIIAAGLLQIVKDSH